jgi:hypothetical protein
MMWWWSPPPPPPPLPLLAGKEWMLPVLCGHIFSLLALHFGIEAVLLRSSKQIRSLALTNRADLIIQVMWLVGSGCVPYCTRLG